MFLVEVPSQRLCPVVTCCKQVCFTLFKESGELSFPALNLYLVGYKYLNKIEATFMEIWLCCSNLHHPISLKNTCLVLKRDCIFMECSCTCKHSVYSKHTFFIEKYISFCYHGSKIQYTPISPSASAAPVCVNLPKMDDTCPSTVCIARRVL